CNQLQDCNSRTKSDKYVDQFIDFSLLNRSSRNLQQCPLSVYIYSATSPKTVKFKNYKSSRDRQVRGLFPLAPIIQEPKNLQQCPLSMYIYSATSSKTTIVKLKVIKRSTRSWTFPS
ncbi:hypothetical protein J6590_098931, partial [Homalodisca vitripennis]